MPNDLISRDALLSKVKTATIPEGSDYVTEHDVLFAPAVDAVEVVRCKDCKWWSGVPCGTATPEWCECSSILGMRAARANNFCSYGERRADA
jgi:hypothetical protein